MAVEHIRLVIRAQLQVGFAAGPSPAHSHVSTGHRLELEIPAARLHRIRALHAEEADLIDAQPLHHVTWGQKPIETHWTLYTTLYHQLVQFEGQNTEFNICVYGGGGGVINEEI